MRNRQQTILGQVGKGLGIFLCGILLWVGCQEQYDPVEPASETDGPEQTDRPSEVPKGAYWLAMDVDRFGGRYTMLCNGFPVRVMGVNVRGINDRWAGELQTALIGEGNRATIKVWPRLAHDGEQLSAGPVQFEAWIEVEEYHESYVPLHTVKGNDGNGRIYAGTVDSTYEEWRGELFEKWKQLLREQKETTAAFMRIRG